MPWAINTPYMPPPPLGQNMQWPNYSPAIGITDVEGIFRYGNIWIFVFLTFISIYLSIYPHLIYLSRLSPLRKETQALETQYSFSASQLQPLPQFCPCALFFHPMPSTTFVDVIQLDCLEHNPFFPPPQFSAFMFGIH